MLLKGGYLVVCASTCDSLQLIPLFVWSQFYFSGTQDLNYYSIQSFILYLIIYSFLCIYMHKKLFSKSDRGWCELYYCQRYFYDQLLVSNCEFFSFGQKRCCCNYSGHPGSLFHSQSLSLLLKGQNGKIKACEITKRLQRCYHYMYTFIQLSEYNTGVMVL